MHTVTIFLYLSMLKTIHTHTFNSNLNTSFLFYHIYNSLLWQWENWFLFSLIYLLIWPNLLCVTSFLPLLLPPPLLYSCPPHLTKIMNLHTWWLPTIYVHLPHPVWALTPYISIPLHLDAFSLSLSLTSLVSWCPHIDAFLTLHGSDTQVR